MGAERWRPWLALALIGTGTLGCMQSRKPTGDSAGESRAAAPASNTTGAGAAAPAYDTAGSGALPGLGGSRAPTPCPCTRRPEGKPHHQCPRGTGLQRSAAVGPDGGAVSLQGTPATKDAGFVITVPPLAVDRPVHIVITETREPPPDGYVDFSPVYQVGPDELWFSGMPQLRMSWQSSLTEIDRQLSIYWAPPDGDAFERLEDSYLNAGFSEATLPGPGYFFAGYPQPEALADCFE